MSTRTLRGYQEELVAKVKALSEPKLKVALDFVDYLQSKEEWDATLEILASKSLMADVKAAEADWRKGRTGKFKPWSKVKRNV